MMKANLAMMSLSRLIENRSYHLSIDNDVSAFNHSRPCCLALDLVNPSNVRMPSNFSSQFVPDERLSALKKSCKPRKQF
jgi:hypothetical protein